jgi:hypothetical protein
MKDPKDYRITIEDLDPTWSEWHSDRLPDVHGMPAGTGHYWTDRRGARVDGYEAGGSCGGCGWSPDEDPIDSGMAAVRYENVFGHRPGSEAPHEQ